MNAARRKGTAAESAVVTYLRSRGWIHAERRSLNGSKDRGDIAGIPGVVVEVKSGKEYDLAGWMKETATEQLNDNAKFGVLVVKPRRVGETGIPSWYAVMPLHQVASLLRDAGYGTETT